MYYSICMKVRNVTDSKVKACLTFLQFRKADVKI